MPFPKFLIIQLLLTAIFMTAAWFIVEPMYGATTGIVALVAVGITALAGIIAYAITRAGVQKRVAAFMNYLLGGMLAKLFVGIITVTVVALNFKEHAFPFILTYFLAYILFTSFEVYALMRNLRPILKERERDSDEEKGNK